MKLSKIYSRMSDDELFNIYTDLGAMGAEMDCTPQEWQIICAEVERRTPIPFLFFSVEPIIVAVDEDTGVTYWDVLETPIDYMEAIDNLKANLSISVYYRSRRELKYIPDVFLNCYWDEDKKRLISIPRVEDEELPF